MSDESLARAFSLVPGVRSYVALPVFDRFVCEVIQAVRDGEGLAVVTGAAGTGKTLLGMVVADRLANDRPQADLSGDAATGDDGAAEEPVVDLDSTGFEDRVNRPDQFLAVSLQTSGLTTRRSMLQAILHGLGEPFTGLSEQESRLRVLDAGRAAIQAGRPIVILLDEADQASPRILEDLRALTNFVHDDETIFRVVLIGSNELEERLGTTELESVNHRVVCQVSLAALTKGESAEYLARRLELVGVEADDLMTPVAIEEISEIAGGVPRAINMLAAKALEKLAQADENPAPDDEAPDDEARDDEARDGATSAIDDNEWDEETGSDSGRVTRSVVLAALDDLESLPIAWRRPLAAPDESFWNRKRRSDELPPLEPLGGAVLEVGGASSGVTSDDEPPAEAESQADDLEPVDPVVSESDLSSPAAEKLSSSICEIAEQAGELPADSNVAGSLPSPLLRMREVLGDDGGTDDRLAQIAASILQGVQPATDGVEADEDAAVRSGDDDQVEASTEHDSVVDGQSKSDEVHESVAANPSLDDTAFRDILNTDADLSDQLPLTSEPPTGSRDGEEAEPVSEVVGEFAEPFPAPIEEPEELAADAEQSEGLIEQIPIEAVDSNSHAIDAESENGGIANDGDHVEGDSSDAPGRDRGKSATDFVEAVLPLVGANDPDASSVAQLEEMLNAADSPREGGARGDESEVGRDALNLAAEVRGLLERDEDEALSRRSNESSRPTRGDFPSFAFDEPRSVAEPPSASGPTEIVGSPAKDVESFTRPNIDHDTAGKSVASDESDAIHAVSAGSDFERAIRKPRRLEGLFTRLRQSRSST